MQRIVAALIVVLSLLLAADLSFGHRDMSKPLFVAADGTDSGRCQDAAAPCRSIAYALSQAGKGAEIRVAAGSYSIEKPENLFMLISGNVAIGGGYDRASAFVSRGEQLSTLSGVPEQFRPVLRNSGFHVIADVKGADTPLARDTGKLLAVQDKLQNGNQAGPCVGGMIDNLACDRVDLLAHIPFSAISRVPSAGNDVWGFQDLNTGREYVIAGFNRGTAVFDVTDPLAPREVGFIDGQNASWRDIKVYQFFDGTAGRWRAYAYVTTDGSSDGLFVIDLGDLPHAVSRVNYASQFSNAHNVYSTSTDFSTGLPLTSTPRLIIAGSNLNVGQYRAYDLANPANPLFVSGSNIPNVLAGNDQSYMHDAASLLITDERKDTQCVNGVAYCELLLDFNEERVAVWDITNITDPQHLNAGLPEYGQRGYVHSGWWTEDRQFMFVHDELDEQRSGLNTTLRVFSLADLRNPQLVGNWIGPTNAIDHNGFVRGNRYYMSNYKRGLTILDITDPASPVLTGHLDTYPFGDDAGFSGAWGVFPFLPSGTIAISDINSGVYLARDRSRGVDAGSLAFQSTSFAVAEGQLGQFTVNRTGNSIGAVSVDVEVVHATGAANDYSLLTATLSWPDGDSTARTVDLAAVADGGNEGLELLLLRLVNPGGGATLGDQNSAEVYVSEAGAASELRLFDNDVTVSERGFGKAIVVVQRTGSAAGAVSVDYSMTAGDATAGDDFSGTTSGTLSWADGDATPKWLEFAISDDGVNEATEFFELTLSNPGGAAISGSATQTVRILNGTGQNLAPNALVAGSTTVNENTQVTLDGRQSNDPDGDSLVFQWTQVSGPNVTLSSPSAAVTNFTAPAVSSDALLQFRLTVTDPAGLSDSATASVTVRNVDSSGGGGGGGGAAGLLLVASLLVVAARRRLTRRDAA
ncbi:MAG: choice-of-anchor B family protein [Woeseia sp.]